jgi:hypothetical protein
MATLAFCATLAPSIAVSTTANAAGPDSAGLPAPRDRGSDLPGVRLGKKPPR